MGNTCGCEGLPEQAEHERKAELETVVKTRAQQQSDAQDAEAAANDDQ